ncbi:MAG: LON peptidase substrate-binding domain-containing protein, partial [Polyangiaceae bacterium]
MSEGDERRKPNLEAALHELPLFPLGEVVLFPNVLLPLHVFEPRYRKMLKDCLASHGAIAIVHVE